MKRLLDLGVVNNGEKKTIWEIKSHPKGVYLNGERLTYRGTQRIFFMCGPQGSAQGSILLWTVFDPQNREDEIMSMNAISIKIDNRAIPIRKYQIVPTDITDGWVNAAFLLNADIVSEIRKAKKIGTMFQYDYGDPIYLGFDGLDFTEGATAMEGFLRTCY